jgi:hypothetical protein
MLLPLLFLLLLPLPPLTLFDLLIVMLQDAACDVGFFPHF